ncbi:MAG: hypothetical protein U0Y82_03945 [Thermoleophilia bacterium]
MLNARLYRTAWLVAGVAIIVAFLTLRSRPAPPEPTVPPAIQGSVVRDAAADLEGRAPFRAPGSQGDGVAADWMQRQLEQVQIPGLTTPAARRVRRQEFSARVGSDLVKMTNVYLVVPGPSGTGDNAGVVVVAPRDEPAGLTEGTSASALLVELARLTATTAHVRPFLFVSTTASTAGNAGMRWFLSRFSDFKIAAVVVLDAPADGADGRVWVWSQGRDGRQALDLDHIARAALARGGMAPVSRPGLLTQLSRMAIPQTFGDQGPAIADGVPAVTIAARPDTLPRPHALPTGEHLTLVGNAVMTLLGTLDQVDRVDGPSAGIAVAGRELPGVMVRVVLLLLAVPLLVATVDGLVRLRRAGLRVRPGLRAVVVRCAPLLVGGTVLHLLGVAGMLPSLAAGAPALPSATPFGSKGAFALGVSLITAAIVWALWGRRPTRVPATPAAQAAAGLLVLSLAIILTWALHPTALLLIVPAAHAGLVATSAPRRGQVAALAVVAVLPLAVVTLSVGQQIDRGPLFAAWYLVSTAGQGGRGALGPLFVVATVAALWAMSTLVALRVRSGVLSAAPAPPARRPRVPRRTRSGDAA